MEAIEGAGGVGVRNRLGGPHAGGGPAGRLVPSVTDPPAAGAVRDGRPGLRAVPPRILRLSPDVLAAVPGRLGLPDARGAERGGRVPAPAPRPGPARESAERRGRGSDAGTGSSR